jgi:hypothetical protein
VRVLKSAFSAIKIDFDEEFDTRNIYFGRNHTLTKVDEKAKLIFENSLLSKNRESNPAINDIKIDNSDKDQYPSIEEMQKDIRDEFNEIYKNETGFIFNMKEKIRNIVSAVSIFNSQKEQKSLEPKKNEII